MEERARHHERLHFKQLEAKLLDLRCRVASFPGGVLLMQGRQLADAAVVDAFDYGGVEI